MKQLCDYIGENQIKLYKTCLKFTKNKDTAWDLLQDVYIKADNCKNAEITNIHGYVFNIVKFTYIMGVRAGKNKIFKRSVIFETYNEAQSELGIYTTIDTKKVLEIMNKVCFTNERQAINNQLNTDDSRSNAFGKNFETLKASRRNGIKKIRNYLGE